MLNVFGLRHTRVMLCSYTPRRMREDRLRSFRIRGREPQTYAQYGFSDPNKYNSGLGVLE
jgi:hypothetical protein